MFVILIHFINFMYFDYSKHQRYLIQNQLNPNYNHTIDQLGTSIIYDIKDVRYFN